MDKFLVKVYRKLMHGLFCITLRSVCARNASNRVSGLDNHWYRPR